MDRYVRVHTEKEQQPTEENEVRITAAGKTRNYISYATNLLTEKGHASVVLKAMGKAINKTVTIGEGPGRGRAGGREGVQRLHAQLRSCSCCAGAQGPPPTPAQLARAAPPAAEIIKRRIAGLHQITRISSIDITDTWDPLEEGLDRIETTRHVSVMTIILSKVGARSAASQRSKGNRWTRVGGRRGRQWRLAGGGACPPHPSLQEPLDATNPGYQETHPGDGGATGSFPQFPRPPLAHWAPPTHHAACRSPWTLPTRATRSPSRSRRCGRCRRGWRTTGWRKSWRAERSVGPAGAGAAGGAAGARAGVWALVCVCQWMGGAEGGRAVRRARGRREARARRAGARAGAWQVHACAWVMVWGMDALREQVGDR